MAASNRYSQITPSQFNPLSLEEVMMVPMMKRQQHDTLNSKIESQIAELAKVKPTDRDFIEAQKEKQRLNDMMMSQAERLAKEGVNPNSTSDFLKFNRDFQESISPTGKIGMFNDAYIQKEARKSEFLKNATAMKYSPEDVQKKLNEIEKDYLNTPVYDDQGRVTLYNTEKYLPPSYYDHIDEAQKFFKDAGIDASKWGSVVSGITFDPNTGSYVSTSGSSGEKSSNATQRQAVIDFMNERISPQGDIGKSLNWRGYSPQKALEEIQAMSGIYKKDTIGSERTQQISNFNPITGEENTTPPVIVDTKNEPVDFEGSRGQSLVKIQQLQKKFKETGYLTPDEQADLNIASDNYEAYKNVVKSGDPSKYDPTGALRKKYGNTLYELSQKQSKLEKDILKNYKLGTWEYDFAKSYINNTMTDSNGRVLKKFEDLHSFNNPKKAAEAEKIAKIVDKTKVREISQKYQNYHNDIFENNNGYTPGYGFARPDKDSNEFKPLNAFENSLSTLLSNRSTAASNGIIVGATDQKGRIVKITGEDREDMLDMLSTGVEKVEFVQVNPRAGRGIPTVTVKVTPSKEAKEASLSWWNNIKIGGEGKSFNLELAVDRFSNIDVQNNIGTGNIYYYLTKYLNTQGKEGQDIAKQMAGAIYEGGKGVGTKRENE